MTGTVLLLTSAFLPGEEGVTATFTLLLAPVDAMRECACWSRSVGELGTLCPQHVEIFRLSKSLCWGLLACRQPGPSGPTSSGGTDSQERAGLWRTADV